MNLFVKGHYYLFYGHDGNNSYKDVGTDLDRALDSALSYYLFITRNDFGDSPLTFWILYCDDRFNICVEDITQALIDHDSANDPEDLNIDLRGF